MWKLAELPKGLPFKIGYEDWVSGVQLGLASEIMETAFTSEWNLSNELPEEAVRYTVKELNLHEVGWGVI